MSDDFENDSTNGEDDQSASALRKAVDAANKRAKEAEEKAAAAESVNAQRNLSDSLGSRGYAPGVAAKITRFISKDEVDLSDEAAVNAWLEENGDVFPKAQPDNDEADNEPDPYEGEAQAMDRMNQVQTHTQPATRTKFEQASNQLGEDASKEEVFKAFVNAGI